MKTTIGWSLVYEIFYPIVFGAMMFGVAVFIDPEPLQKIAPDPDLTRVLNAIVFTSTALQIYVVWMMRSILSKTNLDFVLAINRTRAMYQMRFYMTYTLLFLSGFLGCVIAISVSRYTGFYVLAIMIAVFFHNVSATFRVADLFKIIMSVPSKKGYTP